jgi:hypothetical protein
VIAGVAISRTLIASGGTPSTASRCTTRDDGSFTDTTYSVEVAESDCTGARLERSGSGPYVATAGLVEPASSCCLLTTQSSEPSECEPLASQSSKMSAASTTTPSATPSRGWSAQPFAVYVLTVQPPVGSTPFDTASSTASPATSAIDASQRPLGASKRTRGSVSRLLSLAKSVVSGCVCTCSAAPEPVRQTRIARLATSTT